MADRAADDLGDLLRDGALPGAVVLQLQVADHVVRTLGGRVHGGHAGTLLGTIALGHCTKDHAVHIDGSRLLEHRPRVRHHLHLAAGVAQTLGGGLQMRPIQRQQPNHDRLAGQRVLDLGVDQVDLVQIARLEIVDGVHRDVTGTLQRRSRCAVLEFLHQTGIFVEQGAVAGLPDDVELGVGVIPGFRLEEFDQILVVGTRHALVRRQHDVGPLGVRDLPHMEEGVHRLLRQMGDDAGDGVPHPGEVGLHVLVVLARLAELGGGDEVHRIGDLHRVLDALDALLEQLSGRHGCRLPRMLSRR